MMNLLLGREVFKPDQVHLISDRAIEMIVVEKQPASIVIDNLQKVAAKWRSFDCALIEISSFTEFFLATEPGLVVNTFTKRGLDRHADLVEQGIRHGSLAPVRGSDVAHCELKDDQVRSVLVEVKSLFGSRPIVWVSQANVVEKIEDFGTVHRRREHLKSVVQKVASDLGDPFCDPTMAVRALGQGVAFKQNGQDHTHFTPEGLKAVAEMYASSIKGI
jgi:hypothetical protein